MSDRNVTLFEPLVERLVLRNAYRGSKMFTRVALFIGIALSLQLFKLPKGGFGHQPFHNAATSIAATPPSVAVAASARRVSRRMGVGVHNWCCRLQSVGNQIGSRTLARLDGGLMRDMCALAEVRAAAEAVLDSSSEVGSEKNSGVEDKIQTEQLARLNELIERLRDVGITELRPLQNVAIKAVMRYDNVFIHAVTGSGKTLCFALPMLSRLKTEGGAPRQGLVLVPNQILAAQHERVFNALHPDSTTMVQPTATKLPDTPIVVGTPDKVLSLLTSNPGDLRKSFNGTDELYESMVKNLQTIVVDEADSAGMFDELPKDAKTKVREMRARKPNVAGRLFRLLCKTLGSKLQVLGASATIGRNLRMELQGLGGPEFVFVREPNWRQMLADEDDIVVRSSSEGNLDGRCSLPAGISIKVVTYKPKAKFKGKIWGKKAEIMDINQTKAAEERNLHKRAIKVLGNVLVRENAIKPLYFVRPDRDISAEIEFLRQCGLDAEHIRGAVIEQRGVVARGSEESEEQPEPANDDPQSPLGRKLLVAHPLDARGLDVHDVDLVIIDGAPETRDSFLHMAGRTARMDADGRVILIATQAEWMQHKSELMKFIGPAIGKNLENTLTEQTNFATSELDLWLKKKRRQESEENYV